jgi:hypothetical protein
MTDVIGYRQEEHLKEGGQLKDKRITMESKSVK